MINFPNSQKDDFTLMGTILNEVKLPLLLYPSFCQLSEDDCACADTIFNQPIVMPSTQNYVINQEIYQKVLAQDIWLIFNPNAPTGVNITNKSGWHRLQSFEDAHLISHPFDLELLRQGLIAPQGIRIVQQPQKPQILTAWLHITNACNLNCAYCYVTKSSEHMGLETGLVILEKVFSSAKLHGFKEVKIKYSGGEPFLQFDLLKQLHCRAIELAETTGLELSEVILSNGILIDAIKADWLIQNNIRLMLSIDGVGNVHDALRKTLDGSSSFDVLSRTVDQVLLPRAVRPFISVTVTSQNALNVDKVVQWALERGLSPNLNFYRRPLHSTNSYELELEEETIIRGMLAAYAVVEAHLPDRPLLDGLLDRCHFTAHRFTCGVGQSYVVFDHKGRLSQCQMLLGTPLTSSPIDDVIDVIKRGPIQNLAVDEKFDCRACLYRYRCGGGCPLETHRVTGSWDAPSPNCHIYKTLFPVLLRLEAMRLLKHFALSQ